MGGGQVTQVKFWKKSPPPHWRDLRALSLLIPAVCATVGAIMYSIQGIAVSQGGVLPAEWVNIAVQWGSVMLGIGCEGGTMAACIEIARKMRDGDSTPMNVFGLDVSEDALGIGVSYSATVFARLLALGTMSGIISIVILVFASAADAYFLYKEAGDYLSIRDRNWARWETARWWYEEMRNLPAALHALVSDEPMELSEELQRLKAYNNELQATLEDSNKEEQRLVNVVKELQKRLDNERQQIDDQEQAVDNNDATATERVNMLLASTSMSDSAIAKIVGCSRQLVNRLRKELSKV